MTGDNCEDYGRMIGLEIDYDDAMSEHDDFDGGW